MTLGEGTGVWVRGRVTGVSATGDYRTVEVLTKSGTSWLAIPVERLQSAEQSSGAPPRYKNTDQLLSEIANHEDFVDLIATQSMTEEPRIILRYRKPVAGKREITTVDIEDCMMSGAILSAAMYLGIKAEWKA